MCCACRAPRRARRRTWVHRRGSRWTRAGPPGRDRTGGEPGIGKTRPLREPTARAEASGRLALSGSASELERNLPFSVFVHSMAPTADGKTTFMAVEAGQFLMLDTRSVV